MRFTSFKRIPAYFILTFLLSMTILAFNLTHTKEDGFFILNRYHTPWLDYFFIIYTHVGDGLACIALIIALFLLGKKKKTLTLLLAFLTSGLLAALVKVIFHQPRPKAYFELTGIQYPYFIKEISLHSFNSFPSGHTTTAFTMATVIILVYKKKKLSVFCFLAALMAGYSRVYLAQHFPEDVLAGICIGLLCAILSYHLVYRLKILKSVKRWIKKPLKPQTALEQAV